MKSWEREEIEAIARAIWIRQGCPEGRAEEHWHEAEQLFLEKWLAEKRDLDHQVRDLRAQPAAISRFIGPTLP